MAIDIGGIILVEIINNKKYSLNLIFILESEQADITHIIITNIVEPNEIINVSTNLGI